MVPLFILHGTSNWASVYFCSMHTHDSAGDDSQSGTVDGCCVCMQIVNLIPPTASDLLHGFLIIFSRCTDRS